MKVYRWENHGKSMKILELNGAFLSSGLFEKPCLHHLRMVPANCSHSNEAKNPVTSSLTSWLVDDLPL